MNGLPSPLNLTTSQVELYIKCSNLRNKDIISKSDPFGVLYLLPGDGNKWVEVGRTEVIKNNPNPSFTKQFLLDYTFSSLQQLKVEIYDQDSSSNTLNRHDFLGYVEFSLGRVVSAPGQSMCLKLLPKSTSVLASHNCGHITVHVEEVAACRDLIHLQLDGRHLDNKDGLFNKSDPFLQISRIREDGTWMRTWTSEVIKNNLNPQWKPMQISSQKICNGDQSRPLLIECYDWERNGSHQFIGSCQTSVMDLQSRMHSKAPLPLINEERRKKKGSRYHNSGEIYIQHFQISKQYTFMDYLRGGCEINLMVGIDYTASNGAPSTPQSLHFQNPQVFNQYQQAIHSTGRILEEYDSDKRFPVYGFGGQVNGQVDHCFPLTWDPTHPEVLGVDGILRAYQDSFQFVVLSGPTLFAPIIQTATALASQYSVQERQKYFVLLIITDGVIMDMQETIDALVYGSQFPLSIVIVGVGQADFSAMNVLDGDGRRLRSSRGVYASRDIVQFVPYVQFRNHPSLLAQATMSEIPLQLVQFMNSRNFVPNPPLVYQPNTRGIQEPLATSTTVPTPNLSAPYQNGPSIQNQGMSVSQSYQQPNQGGSTAPPPPYQQGPHPGMPPSQQPYQQGPHRGMPPSQQPYQQGPHPGMPPSQQPYQQGPHPGMPSSQQPYQQGPHPGMPPSQQPYQQGPHPGMPSSQQPYQQGPHPGMPPSQQPYQQGHHQGGMPPSQQPYQQGYHQGMPSSQQPYQQGHYQGMPSSQQPYQQGYQGAPHFQQPHHQQQPHSYPLSGPNTNM